MNKLAFLPLLLIIGSMGAYGQTPESYYNQTKLYDNQKSNTQITLSIDKSTYAAKDSMNVIGTVSTTRSGYSVNLDLVDSLKKTINHISVSASQSGFFTVIINFPDGIPSGPYTLVGYYGDKGVKVSVPLSVIGNEKPSSVVIPAGANVQFNKLNLIPQIFRAKVGDPITWLNNDGAVHTLASGAIGVQGRIFMDGKFDTGVIAPGQTATITISAPGNYTYFDPAYPWLVGKLIITGTAQKPTPGQGLSLSDDDVSLTTQRTDLESHQVTLFNDNMTTSFTISKDVKSDNATMSNDKDAKVGKNSMKINVALKKGGAYIIHDYSANKLQDWSHYNNLAFWFKGQNTKKIINVFLRDASWKSKGGYDFVDNSTNWQKIQVPLYAAYYNKSMSDVRGLEFNFNKGTTGQFKIDDIQLVSNGKKTLFDNDMASVFKTWSQSKSDTITLSNDNDAKVGTNSLSIQAETKNGSATANYDYSINNLQDWSNYSYLSFWFKGQSTNKSLRVGLLDNSWKSGGQYTFQDDSSDWKKVQIPIYVSYKNMDLTKVRGLEFIFVQGINGQFRFDDVALSTNVIAPNFKTNDGTYITGETVLVSGNVKVREIGAAISLRVINPKQSIVTVNQIIPKSDNTFSFPLHVSGNQYSEGGTYKISAQYGLLEHKAETSLIVLTPQSSGTYKGFGIYNVNDAFYAVLQTQGSFDITRIDAGQYSTILTNSTLDNIKKTIDKIVTPVVIPTPVVKLPPTKPVSSFPVSDNILLAIWQNRTDLQTAYPEVKQGNLTGLKIWAKTIGWNQDPRLAALIPNGEIPGYLIQNQTSTEPPTPSNKDWIPLLQVVAAVIAIAIGGMFGYRFYKLKKKLPTNTS